MRVLGLDPGVTTGYAVVDVPRAPARPTFVGGGSLRGDAPMPQFVAIMNGVDLVCIEETSGIAFAGKKGIVADLVACAAVHGGIARIAESLGLPVELIRAINWRAALLRKPNASDAEIAGWCNRVVLNMPTRSNVHTRDAIGVAVAGALRRHTFVPRAAPAKAPPPSP